MELEEFAIRPLTPDDVTEVGSVLGLARLDQGDGFYLVAWKGSQPIGHLHLALTNPPELQDVSVLPAYRRRGVARELTAAAETEAADRGFETLRLTVGIDNAGAQALYRVCGFMDTGLPPRRVKGTIRIRTGPIQVDDTLLTWVKVLSQR